MSTRADVIDISAMGALAGARALVPRSAWRRFGVPGARRGRT
jgi:hypothetical protein